MKFVPKTVLTVASVAMFTLTAVMIAGVSLAAPGGPPPPSPTDPVPPGLPIDNGLIGLGIGALAIAFYKINQVRYKKTRA
ncbi:hypothetical protein HC229_06850 [Flavobacterium sp. D33]|nr:hypothetical protein [Flavobacterium selenitireducens]